jgi:hypothetical protein
MDVHQQYVGQSGLFKIKNTISGEPGTMLAVKQVWLWLQDQFGICFDEGRQMTVGRPY